MLISLFVINIIIFIITLLAMLMFNNKISTMNNSIETYLSQKSYKPKSDIKVVMDLIQIYENLRQDSLETNSIDILIQNYFYNNDIGAFNTSKVESVANNGKVILWVITIILFFSKQPSSSYITLYISISMGIILLALQIYFCMDIEKNKLKIKIKNCLYNEYPKLKKQKLQESKVKDLEEQIFKLETKLDKLKIPSEPVVLLESDIEKFIRNFTN